MSRACSIAAPLAAVALLLVSPRVAVGQTSARRPTIPRGIAADARASGLRSLPALRASAAPVIDGNVSDAAWTLATPVSDFIQMVPNPDAPATERTDVRVLLGDDALYVAMRLYDAHADSIVATLARRDYAGVSDWAHVLVDSRHDRRTAYRFALNPAGVKRDGFITGDAEWTEDPSWDAIWDGAVRRDSAGWSAEFRIPLSQLRFATGASAGGGRTWGLEFERVIARRGERSFWAPVPANSGEFVSRFGVLSAVEIPAAGRRVELTPYAVTSGRASGEDVGNPLRDARSAAAHFGVDFRVGLTSDLTLNGTVNPDFGQVEADPSLVNLTGAESFFPEARPFFTEGSNLFRYTLGWGDWMFGSEQLFYSRRVGRHPQLDFPDSAVHTSASEPARVLAAAKVSGRTLGWNVGLLSATTARELGRYSHGTGAALSAHEIEPLTHYGVYRLGKDFAQGRGSVGVIATSTHRRLDPNGSAFLHRDAWVGGVESRQRFGGDRFDFIGHFFASRVSGSTAAIARTQTSFRHLFQRDAAAMGLDSSSTALSGVTSELRLVKNNGGHWRFGVSARATTRGFDANDAGFLSASNFARTGGWIGYEVPAATRFTRRLSTYTNWWAQRGLVGGGLTSGANWWNWLEFHNRWVLSGWVERYRDGSSLTHLRGGPEVYTSGTWGAFYKLSTDPRSTVSWAFDVAGSPTNADGSRMSRLAPSVVVRPGSRAEISAQPAIEHRRNASQFVDKATSTGVTRYLIGDLRQRTTSLSLRTSYAFTSVLTLQGYAQPFLSHGTYARIGEIVTPMARSFDERVGFLSETRSPDGATRTLYTDGGPVTIDNPDFSMTRLNANLVLRWEYRAGSTLYAVWNHGRDERTETGQASMRAMSEQLATAPATNVLLLKWAHYFSR